MRLCSFTAAALFAAVTAGSANAQYLLPSAYNYNRFGTTPVIHPPSYGIANTAFNPYFRYPDVLPSGPGYVGAYRWYGHRAWYGSAAPLHGSYAWPYVNPYSSYGPDYPYSVGTNLWFPNTAYGYGDYWNPDGNVVYHAEAPVAAYSGASLPAVTTYGAPADRAILNVQVPANAKVWVQGKETSQTGPERSYISPPLTPGRDYSYDVKAQWTENGQPVEVTRTVTVRAGERTGVLFVGNRGTAAQ
jgi:uncharacterized protein (TIGR03000 family)